MFTRYLPRQKVKDEGERPFWISFSDLMTALMAMFLVVMSVTLLAVTKKVDQAEQRKINREQEISELMKQIKLDSEKWSQVKVDENTYRIDLGEVVRFERGEAAISLEGQRFLREYVPTLLKLYDTTLGKQWIRRIVVEGFTDQDGTYLYNLWLSLERSRQVVCALYATPIPPTQPSLNINAETMVVANSTDFKEHDLTEKEKIAIRELFLVGGFSSNSTKSSKEESRRVELKLEFWQLDELKPAKSGIDSKDFGKCP